MFGGGSGDSLSALERCAERAVATGAQMWIDRDYRFAGTWRPPANLVLRSSFSNAARLIYTGTGDGIEVTGPIDVDGLVVAGLLPADRRRARDTVLFGVHGALGGERALGSVRIGRLRVADSGMSGFAAINLSRPSIQLLEVSNVYGQGVLLAGLDHAKVDAISARNVGDLQRSGSRRGSAVLMAAETKAIAGWYGGKVGGVRPMQALRIGSVSARSTTDTAVYAHNDRQTGFTGLEIGSVDVRTAGKDGFKVRAGVERVRVGTVQVARVGGAGCVIEGARDVRLDRVVVDGYGVDALGDVLGRPAPYMGGDAAGQSISNAPAGILIANSSDVTLGLFQISHGRSSVSGAEGHGLRVARAERVRARGVVVDVQGNGVRVSGAKAFDLDIDVRNARLAPVLFSDDNMGASDGRFAGPPGLTPKGRYQRR